MNPAVRNLVLATILSCGMTACNREPAAPIAPSSDPAPAATPGVAPPTAPSAAPLSIAEVQMARAVGEDMRAAEPATTFAPADAIYAVVLTEGAGTGTIAARWTFGPDRQPVYQEEHKIDVKGPGVNNFRITKPDGFPAGDYQVDILLDGNVEATRQFKVQ
jgi:hypothetical protein